MSILKRIFGGGNSESNTPVAESSSSIQIKKFGRYTDMNKTKKQLDYWRSSLDKFKNKEFVNSFEDFFHYLRDESIDNVRITKQSDTVHFEIIQGSKVIRGRGDEKELFAEASIAIMDNPSTPVMRKLMGINYNLKYSKFALKDNVLVIKFSSHAIDASPHKLYDALKELAKKADQQDDLLVSEFSSLKQIDTDQIIDLPIDIKESKYYYLIKWIKETKAEIDQLDASKFSGGIAFLLLSLTYKIDFLLCPQGNLTDTLEKIQHMFFAKNNLSTAERNTQILEEYDNIINMNKDSVLAGIYDVKCTFAIANPASQKNLMDMIHDELTKVNWYRENGYKKIELAVYEYIISYAFFNYGMPYPITDMLNIGMLILNPDYYSDFGDNRKLVNGETLNKNEISKSIKNLMSLAKKDYPFANFNSAALKYGSRSEFLDSLLVEIGNIDLRRN